MKSKNPIVIIALVGLAIIASVGIYTLLNPEPARKIHSATYGYYFQDSRVGELQLTSADNRTYQFEGEFTLNITDGEVRMEFHGELGNFRNSVPRSMSYGTSSGVPSPNAAALVDVTRVMTLLLLPEYWVGIDAGYSEQFTPRMISFDVIEELTVEMTAIGKEDVVVPSSTYENCFVVSGTQPDMELEMTLWVTEQGVVPQAEVTTAVGGVDPLTLTMKLEHYE